MPSLVANTPADFVSGQLGNAGVGPGNVAHQMVNAAAIENLPERLRAHFRACPPASVIFAANKNMFGESD